MTSLIPGENLKRIRNLLGMNQTKFIKDVMKDQISRSTLVKWEREGVDENSGVYEMVITYLKERDLSPHVSTEAWLKAAQESPMVTSIVSLLGPIGVIGSAVAMGVKASSMKKKIFDELIFNCPYCQCEIIIDNLTPDDRWICPECDQEFKFTQDRRLVRVAKRKTKASS